MDYLKEIRKMEELTGQREHLQEADLQGYMERQQQRMEAAKNGQGAADSPEAQQDQEVCQRLANMMMEDLEADRDLATLLPEAHDKKETDLKNLRIQARRSGMDKLKNDFTGKERRAARERLAQIGQKQGTIYHARRRGRAAYVPAQRRELECGRHWWNPFRAITNQFGLGSWKKRHDRATYLPVANTIQEDVEITTNQGILKGQLYSPERESVRTGKLVIVYSGSGAAGGVMIRPIVKPYTDAGACVLHVSYRGFGESQTTRNGKQVGTHLCEDSIYQDGRAIYDYAVNVRKCKPSDIILHGFSLGGAVAAKVAADISEENAMKQNEGQMVEESQRLGGIVLHSSIATMKEVAEGVFGDSVLSGVAGWIGRMGSGNFDTRAYMQRLHRYDPNIPVHYRGGAAGDNLSMHATRLDQDEQARFANSSVYNGNERHMNRENPNNRNSDDVYAGNMNAGLVSIRRMARSGRNARLHY